MAIFALVALPTALATSQGSTVVRAEGDPTFSSVPLTSWRVNGTGRAVLKVGNTVYVGGSFSQAISPDGSHWEPRRNLAAFDARTGDLIEGFRADTDNAVWDIETDGSSLFVGGVFTMIGGVSRARLAALDLTTGAVHPGFRADTNGNVYAISPSRDAVFVVGAFGTIGGSSRSRVAKLAADTGAVDPTFRAATNGTVRAVAATPDGTRVYLGGDYTTVNGASDTDISVVDAATGATAGQDPTRVVGGAHDLQVTADGEFVLAGHGDIGNRVGVYATASGRRQWRRYLDGDVQSVHLIGETVYAGFHDGADGDGASRIAGYDLHDGTKHTDFAPSFDQFMGTWSIDGDDDALVLAGSFTTVSGIAAQGFAIFPAAPPTSFSAAVWGSQSWRYLDDGTDLGTAWRGTEFDDAGWASGVGEFGYGDGDEKTRTSYVGSSSNRNITTYFRTDFTADSTPETAAIYLRVDDGAVVYVNGVEAARDNMDNGSVDIDTLAFARDGWREDSVFYHPIDPTLIRPGTNTVAVEVHQSSPASYDLTFFATLVAYGSQATPPTTTSTAPPTTATTSTTTAPPVTTVPTAPGTGIDVTTTATWAYHDHGTDLGTAWRQPDYDDTDWNTGIGEFGYGDGDETTLVDYGPTAHRKYPTTYFRTTFTADGTPTDLTLQLRIDDGAVAYLNGNEVARINMPTGPITYDTRAPNAFWGTMETLDRAITIDPNRIRTGTNTLAVEVHQNTLGSSDLTFLATLHGDA